VAERIARHQRVGDLLGELTVKTALFIDADQFFTLEFRLGFQFRCLARNIGLFGIALRADRDIFARRHRHRACDQPGNTRYQNARLRGTSRCHPGNQAGRRNDTVIRTQYRRAQPTDTIDDMGFDMQARHWRSLNIVT
jgi:hypothetical protein